MLYSRLFVRENYFPLSNGNRILDTNDPSAFCRLWDFFAKKGNVVHERATDKAIYGVGKEKNETPEKGGNIWAYCFLGATLFEEGGQMEHMVAV